MDEELLPGPIAFSIIRELTHIILFNSRLSTSEEIVKMILVAQSCTIATVFVYQQQEFLEKLLCMDFRVQLMFRNLQETVRVVG